MKPIKIVIPGNPVTKKNNPVIARGKGGRPFILPSKRYREYEARSKEFLTEIVDQPINIAVNVKCIYYMQSHRRVDLVNLLEATDDILVACRVLEDDNFKIIASHDGSRVFYDKENPRAEIYIQEFE